MDKKGMVLGLVLVFMFLLVAIATGFVTLANNEVRVARKQRDSLKAFFLAEAAVEKALFELHADADYSGELNVSLGDGVYDVAIADLSTEDISRKRIDGTGYVPGKTSPRAQRQIRVIAEKPDAIFNLGGALTSGGDVEIKGDAVIEGYGEMAVSVPTGFSVSDQTDNIPEDKINTNGQVPTFEGIFGITEEQMERIADIYVHVGAPPPNEPWNPSGITWIQGGAKFTKNDWHGEGVLIVEGNLDITGGQFDGVIYVLGGSVVDTELTGNINIKGALVTEGAITFKGTSDLEYYQEKIDAAEALFPYEIVSWEET